MTSVVVLRIQGHQSAEILPNHSNKEKKLKSAWQKENRRKDKIDWKKDKEHKVEKTQLQKRLSSVVYQVITQENNHVHITFFFLISVIKPSYLTEIYHHHHQVILIAWSPLTLSHHPFLSFISSIIPGRSSSLHQVSRQCWCMQVFTGWPTLVCPYVGVHRRMSLMSLSLLPQ